MAVPEESSWESAGDLPHGVKVSTEYPLLTENYFALKGIEAEIQLESPICKKNINEIGLPKGIRIGSILRNQKIIIPNSKTIFHENDDVVFFAETKCIKTLEKILSINH